MAKDRLSELPDSIVEHIFSYLPTLEAVRTSLISKRFRNSWTWISALDFQEEVYGGRGRVGWKVFEGKKFRNMVSQVVNLHKADQVDRLRLRCFVNILNDKLSTEVESWLEILLRKQLKVCSLEFPNPRSPGVCGVVPQSIFTCRSLVKLRLIRCTVQAYQPAQLASLKILCLIDVLIDDGALKNIIEGCPSIQEVDIVGCRSLISFDFPTSGTQKLMIDFFDTSSSATKHKINCPSLKLLHLKTNSDVEIIDISSVTDASISLSIRPNAHRDKTLMEKVTHLKTLTARGWLPEMFAHFLKANVKCPDNCWKFVKVVDLWQHEYDVQWVICLLRHSPYLEKFFLQQDKHRRQLQVDHPLDQMNGGFHDWTFDYQCLRTRLKKVKIRGYSNPMCAFLLQLAEIILMNACVLEEFVIEKPCTKGANSISEEELLTFREELSAIPMISEHAALTLS